MTALPMDEFLPGDGSVMVSTDLRVFVLCIEAAKFLRISALTSGKKRRCELQGWSIVLYRKDQVLGRQLRTPGPGVEALEKSRKRALVRSRISHEHARPLRRARSHALSVGLPDSQTSLHAV